MGKVKSAKIISGPKPSKATKSKPSSSSTPSSSSGPLKISSFTVLPLAYPSNSVLPSSSSSSSKSSTAHYLYIRAHAPTSVPAGAIGHEAEGTEKEEQEESRTLFVANLPTDATEESLRGLFGGVGPIEDVRFIGAGAHKGLMKGEEDDEDDEEDAADEESSSEEESEVESEVEVDEDGFVTVGGGGGKGKKGNKSMMKPSKPTAAPKITPLFSSSLPLTSRPTCSSALITYLSALSLSRALSTLPSSKPRPYVPNPSTSSSGPISALTHYLTRHTHYRPPLSTIKSHADSSLAHHEHLKTVELARLTRAGQQEIVDEDGFTLVVRGGKYGRNLVGGGVGVASKSWDKVKEEETAKKKKSKELNDFYRWQKREAKRDDLASLRSKFAADKEKVEKLKGSRRFNPY